VPNPRRALLPIVAALLLSPPAFAQSSGAQARALFREARELMNKERYAEACPKFEESLRLDHGIGTQFNLAHCWEKLGRTVSAWALFLDVASAAHEQNQRKREAAARERAAELEAHLPHLRIDVAEPVEGLEVQRSGETVGRAAWGTAMPIDPGTYHIEASAPGKEPWSTSVDVPSTGETLSVQIPALADIEKAEPLVSAPPDAPERDTLAESPSGARTAMAWVLAGVGVAAAGTGGFFALRSKDETSAARALCDGGPNGTQCDRDQTLPGFDGGDAERREMQEHRDSAKQAALVSYIGFGVGGAALIGSVLLFVTGSSEPSEAMSSEQPPEASLRLEPLLGDGQQGLVVSGRF
jgi:hypothetical protein